LHKRSPKGSNEWLTCWLFWEDGVTQIKSKHDTNVERKQIR